LKVNNNTFVSSVPSGASTGIYEAMELRDKDNFKTKRASLAVNNVNNIISKYVVDKIKNNVSLTEFDNGMIINLDGSQNQWGYNKSKLGANAILPVSMN